MANIASTIEGRLTPNQLAQLRTVARVADGFGLRCWLVGGGVRDALLGLAVSDLDISAVGATAEFAAAAANALGGTVVSRSQFNTFGIGTASGRLDIAMARRETYARPGALPSVSPGMMADDLARRDFSINAMAVSLAADSWGEALDPFDGQGDLRRGVVRALRPFSFMDDATRIFRAVRYAVRLGFAPDAETERLMRRDAAHMGGISGARVRGELERILGEDRRAAMLAAANGYGVLRAVHPALELNADAVNALERAEASDYADKPLLMVGVMAYWAAAERHAELAARLDMSASWAKVFADTARVKGEFGALGRDGVRRSEIYRRLRGCNDAAIAACAVCVGDGRIAGRLELYRRELRDARALLNGDDLLALGAPQGPQVGAILAELVYARIDGEVATRADETAYARRRLGDMRGG